MAVTMHAAATVPPPIGSYDTALCVLPPSHFRQPIDRLRAHYDKAYGKWPAHINLIYPFVALDSLPQAVQLLQSTLFNSVAESPSRGINLQLNKPDHFSHRYSNTICITDSNSGTESLAGLRSSILQAFKSKEEVYRPHLTIGQCGAQDTSQRDYLLAKAGLLPPIEGCVEELVILVRERTLEQGNGSSQMKVFGTISLSGDAPFKAGPRPTIASQPRIEEELSDEEEQRTLRHERGLPSTRQLGTTYQFSDARSAWERSQPTISVPNKDSVPETLSISSYNVLVDSFYPPARDRYPLLLRTIVSEHALADILVLQEVRDEFLSCLLGDDAIRKHYQFTTHGPPDQSEIGPLASLRNIVVLSRWNFTWEWIPFKRRHKGAVILKLESIGSFAEDRFLPLMVTGVHLTCGLTDGSVAAKKSQLHTIVNYLSRDYQENPWIVAGDFNLTTSSFTVDAALKSKSISPQTIESLSSLETLLSEARLSDSWYVARAETGDSSRTTHAQMNFEDLHDGEEGATFDPTENHLAAEIVGNGSNRRPQRYDRILVKGEDLLRVTGFNMFGFPGESNNETDEKVGQDEDAFPSFGSDHWGIRTSLNLTTNLEVTPFVNLSLPQLPFLQPKKASSGLSDVGALRYYIAKHPLFPTDEEIAKRKKVFALLKTILQNGDVADHNRSKISIVVVPVGSYGLGVWSASSDIDCLCIGSLSAKIFFALAGQRLRKAADSGVRILRKVKAASGTMLELEVRGIKLDLQYCPATRIAERWPEVMQLPPSDPVFDLPIISLAKLKSYRDLDYFQRTIPDLASFRIAHRLIRAWAIERGLYSAKFGFLGGIHISLMLSCICKLLFRDAGAITAADIICTFFNHYANFDWKTQMVFDPFFYKHQPRYQRSIREPMVILGLHPPRANVAHNASLPSVTTITEEFKRADNLLSEDGAAWSSLIGSGAAKDATTNLIPAAHEFLGAYNSYIKIDVQYWGSSLAKGSKLVGWLESKCVLLLVDINRKLPGIHARAWPSRFTMNDTNGKDYREYHGCYLIGLKKDRHEGERAMTESDHRVAQGTLQASLERFSEQIRSDEKYFDAASTWVNVAQVKQSELGQLRLDDREWGDYEIQDSDSDTDDDETAELDDEFDTDEEKAAASATKPRSSTPAQSTLAPVAARKLRPASDILNRLRWDPNLKSSDYVVGYEDRFLGTREAVLDRWKTEQTDEEFIPQHRIVYFKRRSDGVVVWDRETRRDEVFGSGAGRAAY